MESIARVVMVLEFIRNRVKNTDKEKPASDHSTADYEAVTNTDCYESTSVKEVCKTNDKGDFVCDRTNQRWRICKGEKPVSLVDYPT